MKIKGFTLIELLLVIAIIAILAAIVIIAINPAKQLADSRNAQRRSDVNTILNGVWQYSIDNDGNMPSGIPTGSDCEVDGSEICETGAADCTGYVDLSVLTDNEIYLTAIPEDPQDDDNTGTGYFIVQSTNGRITVCAPSAEQGETISVTR